MSDYRWNQSEIAAAYDSAAEHVHPYYRDLQDEILSRLTPCVTQPCLVVDVGGGSGRLVERLLRRYPRVTAVIVDQSAPFLELAAQRLEQFGSRARLVQCRLQDNWCDRLSAAASAIVSMSAVHHLDANEKQAFYRRCFEALRSPGLMFNGDEIRPENDLDYLSQLNAWADHMQAVSRDGRAAAPMVKAMNQWQHRNINKFHQVKQSGDDCHQTIEEQLEYLRRSGFSDVAAPWRKAMWALMVGAKKVRSTNR